MGNKVLIADDDRGLLRALTIRLREAGYEVIAVEDAYQALEMARRCQPDVLVLDINMPAGGGLTVQERVEKITPLSGTPTIYLTGEDSDRTALLAKLPTTYALFHKPCNSADLLIAISNAVVGKPSPSGRQAA